MEVILLAQSAAPKGILLPEAKPPLLYSEKECFCKNGLPAGNKQLGVPLTKASGSRCRYSPPTAQAHRGSNMPLHRSRYVSSTISSRIETHPSVCVLTDRNHNKWSMKTQTTEQKIQTTIVAQTPIAIGAPSLTLVFPQPFSPVLKPIPRSVSSQTEIITSWVNNIELVL